MSLRKQWQKYSTLTFELANIHILPDILNSLCCMAVECVMTTDWPNSKIAFQIEIDNLSDYQIDCMKIFLMKSDIEKIHFTPKVSSLLDSEPSVISLSPV
jgi:hypothetical protein